jgi:cell wall-associated NlpC family hydrolase
MSKADCIAAKAPGYIGMRYRLGEEGPYEVGPEQTQALDIDCSGLVYALMRDCDVRLDGKPFPRETAVDYWAGQQMARPSASGTCVGSPAPARRPTSPSTSAAER